MSPRLHSIRNRQRHAFSRKDVPRFAFLKMNRMKVIVILFVSTLLLGSVYLGMLNQSSTRGFTLKELEQRVAELEQENDRLHFAASELSSLAQIEAYAEAQEMVKVGAIEYLPSVGSAVAAR